MIVQFASKLPHNCNIILRLRKSGNIALFVSEWLVNIKHFHQIMLNLLLITELIPRYDMSAWMSRKATSIRLYLNSPAPSPHLRRCRISSSTDNVLHKCWFTQQPDVSSKWRMFSNSPSGYWISSYIQDTTLLLIFFCDVAFGLWRHNLPHCLVLSFH